MVTTSAEKTASLARRKYLFSLLNPIRLVRSLYKNRELIWNLIKRELKSTYQDSFLGTLWAVILPVLMLLIYTFVFSIIFKAKWGNDNLGQESSQAEFALILFAGLTPFTLFATVLNKSPMLILTVPNYVKKVVFPLEILPVVAVGSALITSLINVGLIVIGCLLVFHSFPTMILLLPLVYIPLLLLTLGLAWFLSSLGVFLRDIGQAVPLLVQILFFMSPVFYSIESVPASFRFLILLNPLSSIIEDFRRVLIWNEFLNWGAWGVVTLLSALVMVLGFAWFSATQKAFSDVM